jgi:predicted nucleic acid-binding protein
VDTSAYSAFKRGHPEVVAALRRAEAIFLNPVVLGELQAGFQKGDRLQANQAALEAFLGSPRVRIAPLEEDTATRYAEIVTFLRRQGTPIPTNDIWIAATAMQLGLEILTTDAHFARVPQVLATVLAVEV